MRMVSSAQTNYNTYWYSKSFSCRVSNLRKSKKHIERSKSKCKNTIFFNNVALLHYLIESGIIL
jgi:hypothetical protein